MPTPLVLPAAIARGSRPSRLRDHVRAAAPHLPLLCAVHCASAPLIAVAAPLLVTSPLLEWGAWVLSAGVAASILATRPPLPHARSIAALAMLGLGAWALVLLGSATGHLAPGLERIAAPCAGLLVGAALQWQARLRHRVGCACASTGAVRAV